MMARLGLNEGLEPPPAPPLPVSRPPRSDWDSGDAEEDWNPGEGLDESELAELADEVRGLGFEGEDWNPGGGLGESELAELADEVRGLGFEGLACSAIFGLQARHHRVRGLGFEGLACSFCYLRPSGTARGTPGEGFRV